MNRHDNSWQRLVETARQMPVADDRAPYGFATRVAAQAFSRGIAGPAVLERFALRGLIAAAALSLAAVAFGYSSIASDDEEVVVGDTVGELLAMASTR